MTDKIAQAMLHVLLTAEFHTVHAYYINYADTTVLHLCPYSLATVVCLVQCNFFLWVTLSRSLQ